MCGLSENFLSHKENPRNASRCRKAPFRAKNESSGSIRAGLLETDAGKPAPMWGRLKVRVSPHPPVVFGGFLTPSDRKFTGKACAVIQSESPIEQVIYTRKNIQFAPQEALKNDHLYQTHWKYNDLPSSFPAERNNSCHSLRSLLNGRCFYSHRQGRRLDGAEAAMCSREQSSRLEPAGQAAASFRGKSCCLNAGCRALRRDPGCSPRFCRRRNSSCFWIQNG